jgi:hypothetical protein
MEIGAGNWGFKTERKEWENRKDRWVRIQGLEAM